MRINHNIAALNTYRQLGTANNAQSASMEKLSSGLRINKAGDDAAGLAISEKMRAQIRGLDQASSNAQDGISMIQTAEGALTESHSILQRMRELATQAANDTNVGVDREEIQKEMNQLTSEINRIGNTTEFNTQKLLNGGGEVKEIAVNTKQAGAVAGAFKGGTSIEGTGLTAATYEVEVTTGESVKINFGKENGALSNDLKVVFASSTTDTTAAAAFSTDTITITLGTDATKNTAAKIQDALKNMTGTLPTGFDKSKITVSGDDPTAVASATDLTTAAKTATKATGGTTAAAGSTSIPITATTTSDAAVAAKWELDALDALVDDKSGSISFAGVTISISGNDGATTGISNTNQVGANLVLDTTTTTGADTVKEQADLIVKAFEAVKAEQGENGSLANFTFSADSNGKITVAGIKEDGAKNNTFNVTSTGDVKSSSAVLNEGPSTAGVTEVRGEYSFEISTAFEKEGAVLNIGGQTFTAVSGNANAANGEFSIGSSEEEQAISLAAAINADSSLNARFDALVDGGKITLREKAMKAEEGNDPTGMVVGPSNNAVQGEFTVNVDSSVAVGGKYAIDGVKIEVTDDANHKGLADGTAVLYSADKTQQASNLANAIAANSALSDKYSVSASADRITLTQKAGKESMEGVEADSSTNKNDNFQASFQIGANTGQSMTIEIEDMRSQALKISGDETGTVTAKNGQVASYVQVANVSNGTDNNSTEFALDVSSHEKASAAVSVINDAIEKVSAQRSNLGAYQNRLDHTINNLGTSSENLTAAESRIRDVDMAKEMMEQTKQSILAQASQAMLAQANQKPQSVLQLLG
ncbi:MAG TPA: flagellin [Ureibacillus sp.]|nr:flagellin [Ureibacillus sp.]